jgi:hypothetical protein
MFWLVPSPASLNETTRFTPSRLALARTKCGLTACAKATASSRSSGAQSTTRTGNPDAKRAPAWHAREMELRNQMANRDEQARLKAVQRTKGREPSPKPKPSPAPTVEEPTGVPEEAKQPTKPVEPAEPQQFALLVGAVPADPGRQGRHVSGPIRLAGLSDRLCAFTPQPRQVRVVRARRSLSVVRAHPT